MQQVVPLGDVAVKEKVNNAVKDASASTVQTSL